MIKIQGFKKLYGTVGKNTVARFGWGIMYLYVGGKIRLKSEFRSELKKDNECKAEEEFIVKECHWGFWKIVTWL